MDAKKIIIKSKKKVFSHINGNNVSTLKGDGLDFFELKEYVSGDDIKRINWKVTARTNKLFVNVFNEEKELNIFIAISLSGKLLFGTKQLKQETVAEILALLGFSTLKNQDKLSISVFSEKEELFIKPTKKEYALIKAIEDFVKIDPIQKTTNTKNFIKLLEKKIKQKSLIFLISDFINEEYDLKILAKKHELFCVIVRDKLEEDISLLNDNIDIVDPVSLKKISLNINNQTINSYKKQLEQNDKNLRLYFLKNRIKFTKIYTHEDPFIKLLKLLK